MDCNVVKDLIPLYIDACCSEDSKKIVKEHMERCDSCRKFYEEMNAPSILLSIPQAPGTLNRINDWKASILQSVLLFLSFALITVGVALEAKTPSGLMDGFWAINLVIPATGFMLSLANWYFVRVYKNRKSFSNCSLIATLSITLCAYIWAGMHYKIGLSEITQSLLLFYGLGIILTAAACVLSKTLSVKFAGMLGKE